MGAVIAAAWDQMMHTAASYHILNATGHRTLEDARAEGVAIAHPYSTEDLLSHLEQIRQCNTSGVAPQVVGVDTEFYASGENGTDRRPVLWLIGLYYVDSTHHTVMISIDMKIVGRMALHDSSRVKAQL